MKIVIIDYGAGNISSVVNAFDRLNIEVELSSKPIEIQSADRVIFPGVGHAEQAMESLQESGLDKIIPSLTQPVLGICLGMQLLCEETEEENTKGLGIVHTQVQKINKAKKVPHMGWNKVSFTPQSIFYELNETYFYFVHSYHVPVLPYTIGLCNYYGNFSAALQKNNFYGCQFHPEKSADAGLRFLEIFINQ